jgi:hypothetical protein
MAFCLENHVTNLSYCLAFKNKINLEVSWPGLFFSIFRYCKLAKFSKSLAKLVEFTLENQIVPNFSQFPNFLVRKETLLVRFGHWSIDRFIFCWLTFIVCHKKSKMQNMGIFRVFWLPYFEKNAFKKKVLPNSTSGSSR